MTADRPFLGILLMLGFCILAPLGDSIAKLLGEVMSVGAMVLIRFGAQAVFLFPLCWALRLPIPATPRLLRLIAIRTVLHIVGIGFMFTALRYLPLADALAIAFVMPFLALLAGWLFMGEEVGPHRLAACTVGFIGTLMVIQPNFVEVGWPALLPLGVAVTFVAFMLVIRAMAKDVDPIAMQAVSGAMALGLILPVMVLFPALPGLSMAGISSGAVWMVLAMGALGTLAHLLMTWSLRFAPSATLAPMQYLEIPFGTLIGWIVFHDLPNGLAALGICVTIAAGLYIILRERAIARRPIQPAPEVP